MQHFCESLGVDMFALIEPDHVQIVQQDEES